MSNRYTNLCILVGLGILVERGPWPQAKSGGVNAEDDSREVFLYFFPLFSFRLSFQILDAIHKIY